MSLFDAWFNAIIVLDANILLNLFRFAPDKSRELLDILERLSNRIWIPRQFWEEYQGNLPTIRQEIKREYLTNKNDFQNLHQKNIIKLEHFSTRTRYVLNPQIALLLDQANTLLVEEVSTFRSEHSTWLRDGDIENRIEQLFASKVGDPLPDSNMADIPSIWQWRLERNIPPGLKDRRKRELYRYGDLTGWLQIVRHAKGRDRPVIFVTDDIKANDWFVIESGNASGAHPDLTRELYDEAGVELYLYTSEQFMRLADIYLRWQRSVAAADDYFRRHTLTFSPVFDKIVATGRMPIFTATGSIFDGYESHISAITGINAFSDRMERLQGSLSGISAFRDSYSNSLSSLAGLTVGASYEGLLDPLKGFNAFGDSMKQLHDSMAGISPLNDRMERYHDSLARISSYSDRMNRYHDSLAGVNAFGDRMERLQTSLAGISAFSDSYSHSLSSLAGLTVGESYEGLLDPLRGFNAFNDRMERLQTSLAGISAFSDSYSHSLSSLAGLTVGESYEGLLDPLRGFNAFNDRMERLQTSLAGISAFSDSYSHSLSSLAGLTVGESYEGLLDPLRGFNAFNDRMERYHDSVARISPLNDRMERYHDSVARISLYSDRMNRYHDSLAGVNALTGGVQQILEQQCTIDAVLKPTLSEVMQNSIPTISDVAKDLTPSANDLIKNPILEELRSAEKLAIEQLLRANKPVIDAQQLRTDSIMEQFREEQRRVYESLLKNISL